jgi:hypothetical protein
MTDHWIRDPVFFTPGSGIRYGKIPDQGSEIRHKHLSKSLVTISGLKVRKFFSQSSVAYPDPGSCAFSTHGSGIWDGKKSGTEDKHPGSTTLVGW